MERRYKGRGGQCRSGTDPSVPLHAPSAICSFWGGIDVSDLPVGCLHLYTADVCSCARGGGVCGGEVAGSARQLERKPSAMSERCQDWKKETKCASPKSLQALKSFPSPRPTKLTKFIYFRIRSMLIAKLEDGDGFSFLFLHGLLISLSLLQ